MNSFKQFSHQYWINKALEIAKENTTDIPIGALIIKDNVIIGKGTNEVEKNKNAILHAEIIAIEEASKHLNDWRLNDCILYTTLEPCPMCTGAIINSRISKIVFGAYDMLQGTCGSKIHLLNDLEKNNIEIIGGILELECTDFLKEFFKKVRENY